MLAIVTSLGVRALVELEHVAGRAAGRAREPELRVARSGRRAPTVAALGCSVVACVAHVATGPFVSISSAIVL